MSCVLCIAVVTQRPTSFASGSSEPHEKRMESDDNYDIKARTLLISIVLSFVAGQGLDCRGTQSLLEQFCSRPRFHHCAFPLYFNVHARQQLW